MNKKIWLTGALCIAAIFITVFVYNNFIMDKDAVEAEKAVIAAEEAASRAYIGPSDSPFKSITENVKSELTYSNDIFTAVFSGYGGLLKSMKLNNYSNPDGSSVDLVFSAKSGQYPFAVRTGGFEAPVLDGWYEGKVDGNDVVFKAEFEDEKGNVFEIIKTWSFVPGSYMLSFRVDILPVKGELQLGGDGYLYSLEIGPQLGPQIEKLERAYVYRYFCLLDGIEKQNVGTPEESLMLTLERPFKWLGVESRYFIYAAVPLLEDYDPAWDEREVPGIFKRNTFFVQRPSASEPADLADGISDSYYFYFGPKDASILELFDNADSNPFGISNLNLGVLSGEDGFVSVLSNIVKGVINLLYKIVKNYGLAIILFALLIQVLIFPVSRRTYSNAIQMQLLGPQIGELRKKYKYNDRKLNEETMKLFEQSGVKPRSSLVPFIIHLPFFILLYILLLTNIDFRLAAFIPGWINDISLPEYIVDIAPSRIPVTAWDKIRLLPVLALAVSLFQSRYIQAPADSIRSMRVMSYLVPIVMFLVIYNMPSGAVLYWLTMTSTNLLLQWRIKKGYQSR